SLDCPRCHSSLMIPESAGAPVQVIVRRRMTAPGANAVGPASPLRASSLGEIKFHCPECKQKIGVDERAAGLSIDCPICRSSLTIPPSHTQPVQVIVRRRLAIPAGSTNAIYAELERKQKELADALKESERLNAKKKLLEAELEKARREINTAATDSRTLQEKADRDQIEVGKLRGEVERLQRELSETQEWLRTGSEER